MQVVHGPPERKDIEKDIITAQNCLDILDKPKKILHDLIIHCKKFLGDFKSPSKIHFFNKLPKGSSGKIQRLKIKDLI